MVGSALLPTCTYASTVRSSYLTSILGNSMFTLHEWETGNEEFQYLGKFSITTKYRDTQIICFRENDPNYYVTQAGTYEHARTIYWRYCLLLAIWCACLPPAHEPKQSHASVGHAIEASEQHVLEDSRRNLRGEHAAAGRRPWATRQVQIQTPPGLSAIESSGARGPVALNSRIWNGSLSAARADVSVRPARQPMRTWAPSTLHAGLSESF
jgi:hypothetical protein